MYYVRLVSVQADAIISFSAELCLSLRLGFTQRTINSCCTLHQYLLSCPHYCPARPLCAHNSPNALFNYHAITITDPVTIKCTLCAFIILYISWVAEWTNWIHGLGPWSMVMPGDFNTSQPSCRLPLPLALLGIESCLSGGPIGCHECSNLH